MYIVAGETFFIGARRSFLMSRGGFAFDCPFQQFALGSLTDSAEEENSPHLKAPPNQQKKATFAYTPQTLRSYIAHIMKHKRASYSTEKYISAVRKNSEAHVDGTTLKAPRAQPKLGQATRKD